MKIEVKELEDGRFEIEMDDESYSILKKDADACKYTLEEYLIHTLEDYLQTLGFREDGEPLEVVNS